MLIRDILLRTILFVVPLSTVAFAAQYDLDPNWPKLIQNEQGSLIVHQPRIDSLNGNDIRGQAAVAVAIADEDDPTFGSVWFRAEASIDESAGSAFVDNVVIEDMSFPDEGSRDLAERIITKAITGTQARVSLNQLNSSMRLAELQDRISDASSVRTDPPDIYVETQPTLLVLTEGEPRLVQEASGGLMRVVNTPFDLFLHPQTSTYYVRTGENWFEAETLSGVWTPSLNPPQAITSLPQRLTEQAAPEGAPAIELASISNVIVSTVPAAMIQMDGQMELSPIAGTDLLFLRNSESDVFFNITNQTYYYLFAGRWFSSKRLESLATWGFVEPSELPTSFANIPQEVPQAQILASVPGTPESQQAVIEATVPQTAQVDRTQASIDVNYAGSPEFAPISGTSLQYAVNTSFSVIKGNGAYYACHDGVWFVSSSPNGPWTVATYVPDEIYNIPKTHPLHNVTYVYVYDHTPRYVYTGYLPGYTGSHIYRNTVFYGTGWGYYPYYSHLYYPYYSYSSYYGYPLIPGFSLFFGILAGSYYHHHYYDHYWYDYGFNSYRYRGRGKNYLNNKRWRRGRNIYRRNVYNRWGNGRIADRPNRNRISRRLQDRRNFGRRNNQNVATQGGRGGRNGNARGNRGGQGQQALRNQRTNNRALNNQARGNRALNNGARNNRGRNLRGRNGGAANNRALTEQLQNNATQNSAARNNRGRNVRVMNNRGQGNAARTGRGRNTGSINNRGTNAPNFNNLTPQQREAAERALRNNTPNRSLQGNRGRNTTAPNNAGQNNRARTNRGRNGRATNTAPNTRNLSPENRALIDQMRNRELQNGTARNNRARTNRSEGSRSQGNRAQPNRGQTTRSNRQNNRQRNAAPQRQQQRQAAPQRQQQRQSAPRRQERSSQRSERRDSGSSNSNRGRNSNGGGRGRRGR